ncbi:Sulfate permease, MFS superfamily [Metschnikowia aff. pulcherrima]|uniref:Sulfate permease, MFS superfamily n=1 Tax=Metschnikowia aff. pulcherrima TaxID=2163413 RepID=A0A4P6XQ81_9ASCO|nr:Sulfate permease, MFS superfamily [Metschnikowia aff. pulcherrima]
MKMPNLRSQNLERGRLSARMNPDARPISTKKLNDDGAYKSTDTSASNMEIEDLISLEEDSSGHNELTLLIKRQARILDRDESESIQCQQRSFSTAAGCHPGNTSLTFLTLLPYYLPVFSWANEYCAAYLLGDLISGLSLATFQIPLAISYSTSLAKVPITCGLYSLGIAPLIYMLFGSVPQMITGPEAPMSLIVGQAIEPLMHHAKKANLSASEYVVAITFVSGSTLLGFGLGRFGFLDNVLSELLLKGFISGVGAVMLINASIPLMGLEELLKHVINEEDKDIHSPFDKLCFVVSNFHKVHKLSLNISLYSFVSIWVCRFSKKLAARSQSRWLKHMSLIPEILIVVFTTTVMCNKLHWDEQGLQIVGSVTDASAKIPLYNPFSSTHLKMIKILGSSGFVCAMLGFFESTTALKSLGSRFDLPISSNRELVALGAINLACSVFGGLPSFGGYGRSKINAITAKTTCSGAIMGILSLLTARFLLRLLYFIPKCVLSVITAVIGVLLMSEGPKEIIFHWKSRGYDELFTFCVTFITTIFFSIEAGIAVGLIYLLLRVIRNSAESNIQILGRIPGTNTFLNADLAQSSASQKFPQGWESVLQHSSKRRYSQLDVFTDGLRPLNLQALEEIEGCLIIKIPEPLTFTNASDLRSRLKRLEMYGSAKAHPALKRSRDLSMSKYMLFDLEGMSSIDSSAAQLLLHSLQSYSRRGIKTFFIKVSRSPVLRARLKNSGITKMLNLHFQCVVACGLSDESASFTNAISDEGSSLVKSIEGTDANRVLSLVLLDAPFFGHIRDALWVIDHYEQRCCTDENALV